MKRGVSFAAVVIFILACPKVAHSQDVKLPLDTLTVEATGEFEAEPDRATIAFFIRVQERGMRKAYDLAGASLQRILQVAQRNGLGSREIQTGRLSVLPVQDWNDKKLKARAYRVEGTVKLIVTDFAKIGPLIDDSVQEGIVDFRSLTYSLVDEESAKQQAITQAMHRAQSRAKAALGENGRQLGALRTISVDVQTVQPRTQLLGYAGGLAMMRADDDAKMALAPPAADSSPERVRVLANVKCLYQVQ